MKEYAYFELQHKIMDSSGLVQWLDKHTTETRHGNVDLSNFGSFAHGFIIRGTLDDENDLKITLFRFRM